jgi:hypothetical protein
MALTNGQPLAQDWQCQHKLISTPQRRFTSAAKVESLWLMSISFGDESGVLSFMGSVWLKRNAASLTWVKNKRNN